jgi:hypothetical protein
MVMYVGSACGNTCLCARSWQGAPPAGGVLWSCGAAHIARSTCCIYVISALLRCQRVVLCAACDFHGITGRCVERMCWLPFIR